MPNPPEPPLNDKLHELMRLTNDAQHPNINALWRIAKDIEGIKLNIKAFGYELATRLAHAKPPPAAGEARVVGLACKPATQADMDSAWAAHWASKLRIPIVYHRKIWEYVYLLQALHDKGLLRKDSRGLGFGCGQEPIPSVLAAMGCRVTMTDLDPDLARGRGWLETGQHATKVEMGYRAHLVARDVFMANVDMVYVDMNAIPAEIKDYDFCWSLCSLEHLGSIEHGLSFIENSVETLRPGGVAVHTTEFNYLNDEETIDDWGTVLFQRKHFEALAVRLRDKGHHVEKLDFDVGNDPMDRFIDLPPFAYDLKGKAQQWAAQTPHLKFLLDGFPATSFGIIVTKGA
jgi:hypothetical protein